MALNPLLAIGLMSGTSMDGVDAVIIETDGMEIKNLGNGLTVPYPEELRERLRKLPGDISDLLETERYMTIIHAEAVKTLIEKAGIAKDEIDLIGFHGHTVLHKPEEKLTLQIGDGALLAELTETTVINDFRRRDIAAGGQGAPLTPIYHAALLKDFTEPVAVVNIGGVANITYIEDIGNGRQKILGFDTGPGNALLDDWVRAKTGEDFDKDGEISNSGVINQDILHQLLSNGFFSRTPPKSLDRNHFNNLVQEIVYKNNLSTEDGAATLSAFTAHSILSAVKFLPQKPSKWFVCGGGRLNQKIMSELDDNAEGAEVKAIESLKVDGNGINGDLIEAQLMGFLAVRSYYKIPITYPEITGCSHPVTGGCVYSKLNL